MEKRQATSTNGKAKVEQKQMDKWQTNIDPKSQKKTPKRQPGTENWPQEGRKWHHKRPKMVPRRAEEGEETIPNHKSKEEPHQNDHMTGLGPQGRGGTPSLHSPQGHHLGDQNGTKTEPKTIPNRKSNQEAHQDYPKTVLGPAQGPISLN